MFSKMAPLALSLGLAIHASFAIAATNEEKSCYVRHSVEACESGDCIASAQRDFLAYASDERDCGVYESNLPFISLANSSTDIHGTVILIHGLTANPSHMRDVIRTLNYVGYHAVVPILFGHGGDDSLLTRATSNDWEQDVEFAVQAARKLGQPLFLFGHSTGGSLAAITAARHPGEFKAFVSFDPALNLDGPRAGVTRYACLASHIWDYPNEVGRGALHFLLGNPDDEHPITHLTPSRENDIANVKIQNEYYAKTFCGEGTAIPSYNYQYTTQSICALSGVVQDISPETLSLLPPSLVILSQDLSIFEEISKSELKKAILLNPQNEIFESSAPMHTLMMGKCTPGYTANVRKLVRWFEQHR